MPAKDTDKTQFIAQGVTVNSRARLGSGLHPGMDCVWGTDVETWAVGTGASCLLLTHSPAPVGPELTSVHWHPLPSVCRVAGSRASRVCIVQPFPRQGQSYLWNVFQKVYRWWDYIQNTCCSPFFPYPSFSVLIILEIYLFPFPFWEMWLNS